jgi:hypothetical protein
MFEQEHLDYLLAVCSGFPAVFRDDVISEVFIRASGVDLNQKDYKRYLRNLAFKVLKRMRSEQSTTNILFDVGQDCPLPEILRIRLHDLDGGIKALPVKWQTVLEACIEYDTNSQAADAMGVSLHAFKHMKYRAIAALRQWVKNNRPDFTELLP